MQLADGAVHDRAPLLAHERARLVRLCTVLTGDADAAEDLTQEALFEALRSEHRLRQPERRPQWLGGIARNVCLRWARSRGHELASVANPRRALGSGDDAEGPAEPAGGEWRAADVDLELELERAELADLLDRAMAMLPPDARAILYERFVRDSPRAEIALRLGLSDGAVAMRLQRGKLALRRVLADDLYREAAAFGIDGLDAVGWRQTRLWCPTCGARRLLGCFRSRHTVFMLRCPGADCHFGIGTDNPWWTDGATGFGRALAADMGKLDAYFRGVLASRAHRCLGGCGRTVAVRRYRPGDTVPSAPRSRYPISVAGLRCPACATQTDTPLDFLALSSAHGRRFWQDHRRIRTLPERELEFGGRPALLTRFESVSGAARLEVVTSLDTFAVLATSGAPRGSVSTPG